MKKLLTILAMLMLAVFVLTSCGGNANTPADTSDVNGGTETEAPESPFSIPEEDMRDWVVDYMFKQAEIKWTPSQTMDLSHDKKGNLVGKTLIFEKGKTYYGLPYINLTTDTDYEDFEAALKWNEGKQMYLYDCPADRSEDAALGNDCSSAILLAWKRFDTSINAYDTGSCFPLGEKSGIYPVGDLVVDGTEKTTDVIVQNTSDEALFAAFAQLKKGDMIMWRLSNADRKSVV